MRRINTQIDRDVLVEAEPIVPRVGRLPDIDGKAKMSKSQGNAILLAATPDEIRQGVHRMYTDPNHLRYRRGGLGDMAVKRRLETILQECSH